MRPLDDEELRRLREQAPPPPPWIGHGASGPPPPPTAVAAPSGDSTPGRLAQLARLRLALWAVLADRLVPVPAAGVTLDELAAAAPWCDCRRVVGRDGERGHARGCAAQAFLAGWHARG